MKEETNRGFPACRLAIVFSVEVAFNGTAETREAKEMVESRVMKVLASMLKFVVTLEIYIRRTVKRVSVCSGNSEASHIPL